MKLVELINGQINNPPNLIEFDFSTPMLDALSTHTFETYHKYNPSLELE